MIDLSPSFFFASNAIGLGAPPVSAAFPPSSLSAPRTSCVPLSPSCLSSVLACGGAGLPCRWAVRLGLSLVARSPCRLAGRCATCLPLRGSSLVSALSAGDMSADCLPCVPRLVAQCGRRVACPAWLVSVIGAGGGTVRLLPSACLDGADGEVWRLCGSPFIG